MRDRGSVIRLVNQLTLAWIEGKTVGDVACDNSSESSRNGFLLGFEAAADRLLVEFTGNGARESHIQVTSDALNINILRVAITASSDVA